VDHRNPQPPDKVLTQAADSTVGRLRFSCTLGNNGRRPTRAPNAAAPCARAGQHRGRSLWTTARVGIRTSDPDGRWSIRSFVCANDTRER
jgi:hypothetical protein